MPELEKHDHLLLETDEGRRLALNDPRRFGSVDLVPQASWNAGLHSRHLGPSRSRSMRGNFSGGFAAGRRRSSYSSATSESLRASATSMFARHCTAPESIPNAPEARSPSSAWNGSSSRSRASSQKPSKPAGRPCATSSALTASWAISPRPSPYTTGRGSHADAAERCADSSRADVRHSTVQPASAEVDDSGLSR